MKHQFALGQLSEEIALIENKIRETRETIFSNLTAHQRVMLARHPQRPYTWITSITSLIILRSSMETVFLPMIGPWLAVLPLLTARS